jgi:prepilin-type N-terminal cleavage/methylation domain-containing protein/prepilin-type processing-associated H-X9-DG protein
MNTPYRRTRGGFTLVELLVVIVIIAMLMGLLTPAIISARAKSRVVQCTNNQKNLGAAVLQYEMNKQQFPGYVNRVPGSLPAGGSWPVMILQQIDRADLWDAWRSGTAQQVKVDLFACPAKAATDPAPLSYVANCGQQDNGIGDAAAKKPPDWPANGVFHNRYPFDSSGKNNGMIVVTVSMSDIKDGTAHTLLISENNQAASWSATPPGPTATSNPQEPNWGMVWWQHPKDVEKKVLDINEDYDGEGVATDFTDPYSAYDHARPSSYHTGGVVATFCDGHVQFLNEKMDYAVYALLMTPDGSKAGNPKTGKPTPQTRKLNESDLQ